MNSLGMIELVGLVGAIEAADVAAKAANVKVLDYELTKGKGLVTVKIVGEVSAVKAAVDAAVNSAKKLTEVISFVVISRPSEEIKKIIMNEKKEIVNEEHDIKEEIKNEELIEKKVTKEEAKKSLK
ncbi:BMC domain-containing protein [Cetobacterium sp.]|uniref:BMC domain-containing protein n=1 Tax=Cetobacterium sp. TaxID=2071632 RepID=UPI0025BEFA87|nr:BMC domain-containing protein [Cetobacterium sp.]